MSRRAPDLHDIAAEIIRRACVLTGEDTTVESRITPVGDPPTPKEQLQILASGEIGRASLIAVAEDHARPLAPLLRALRNEGTITIGAITRTLNERRIPTARGARWHVSSVANLLGRATCPRLATSCASRSILGRVFMSWDVRSKHTWMSARTPEAA
jgi:hypothetical protein